MKKKILVAEDNKIIALDIKRQLQTLDYEVTSLVATGEDAIELCRKHKPDLVLMDIKLKGAMNGLEAAAVIFREFKIPIIHLSGSGKSIYNQVNYPLIYLSKPFHKKDLQEILAKTLNS